MLANLICFGLFLGLYQSNDNSTIQLTDGENQQFKYRHADINILGHFSEVAKEGVYQLNDGKEVPFYVKGIDVKRDKISRNRLFKKGDFNIEIPIASKDLSNEENRLEICVTDASGEKHSRSVTFT